MAHALIFDSGVGGLSVVDEIRRAMPDLHLSYVADDEFRPYGAKTEAQLEARLALIMPELVYMLRPDLVVIACNTASTTALPAIRRVLDIPVIGVVPAIKPAAQLSKTKAIGVLGTPGTVRRKYVGKLMDDFAKDCRVVLKGSLGLVDQAEAKFAGQSADMDVIKSEIDDMFKAGGGPDLDVIVLACTHFPLLRDELKRAAPHSVTWMDSGAAIARRVKSVLENLPPSERRAIPDQSTAFLIGPDADKSRKDGFARYGFDRVVGLLPD